MGAGQTAKMQTGVHNLRYLQKIKAMDRSTTDNPLDGKLSRSISSQDSLKNGTVFKVAVVGARAGVGKSAFVLSLVNQKPTVQELEQTMGLELHSMQVEGNVGKRKVQFWELDSTDRGFFEWEGILNSTFTCIIMIFDEFSKEKEVDFKQRVRKLQLICKENKMTGRVPIYLVGNDRLDMQLSGKEQEIQKEVDKLYDGNKIFVQIVDFTQIKELNNLLSNIIIV